MKKFKELKNNSKIEGNTKESVEESYEPKESVEEVDDELFKTENERLVEKLPFGDLTDEELDNVMGGRYR
jgi:hypothetical protein